MTGATNQSRWSYRAILTFWWCFLVTIQQTERWFLLPEAWKLEQPETGQLAMTLWIGLWRISLRRASAFCWRSSSAA